MAKTSLDELLNDFTEAWNAGERPRVDDYVARASPGEQDELAGLIRAFLEIAPKPRYTKEQLKEIESDPIVQQIGALVESPAGLWPTLLPRLRNRVKLTREQVVEALAAALGVQNRERKVQLYYQDRKSTRLNSSHPSISYAVFCLKK